MLGREDRQQSVMPCNLSVEEEVCSHINRQALAFRDRCGVILMNTSILTRPALQS